MLRREGRDAPLTVPKGAEVLLETRLPYLSADQRREVLRTTALPAGYVLLDGFEQWGRLDLFTAADGYGSFASDVTVTLDASAAWLPGGRRLAQRHRRTGRTDEEGHRHPHPDRPQPLHRRNRRGGRCPGVGVGARAGPR